MSSAPLRPQVLSMYRKLMRSSRLVFGEDTEKQRAAVVTIREGFRANGAETDPKKIKKLIRGAGMANDILRNQVFECVETDTPGTFRMNCRQDQLVDLRPKKAANPTST